MLRTSRAIAVVAACGSFVAALAAAGAAPGPAAGATAPCFTEIPPVPGIPPWGFHTGAPITGQSGSYARAVGRIDLDTDWISGTICQVDRSAGQPDRLIVLRPEPRILFHTHTAVMWGYPGNLIRVDVKVASSTDPRCAAGTVGRMTMYASYNGVRSDSVQLTFPAACRGHDHLYHGAQVNAQVPPA